MLGVFFCAFPMSVKAAEPKPDYEVGLKFYKVDETMANDMISDFTMWGMKYQFGMTTGTMTEITDLDNLKTNEYVVVAPTMKTIGTANASGLSFYFTYNDDYLKSPIISTEENPKSKAAIANKPGDTIYPNSTFTVGASSDKNGVASITISPSASGMQPVNSAEATPAAFFLFKVIKDTTAAEPLQFKWYTINNPLVEGVNTYYSAGSSSDSKEILFQCVDYAPEAVKSSDVTLSALSVTGTVNGTNYALTPEFVAGSTTASYTVNVPYSVENIDLQATPTHVNAKILPTELGNKSLNLGSNRFEFTVTAEDTSTKIYSVTVNRQNNVATLNTLTVDGDSVTGFVSDSDSVLEFTLDPVSSDTITIAATPTDSKAKIADGATGSKSLKVGDNTFVIKVTSEDGSVSKTYTIKVKRKSNVATLSGLSVSSNPQGTMGSFASDTKTYTYTYDETVGNVTINATATHNEAMVKIGSEAATKGSATSNSIDPKTTSSVDITVTAEDGIATDSYRINFEREKSSVNTLKSLSVKDSSGKEYITSFASNTKTYNITVAYDITSLDVTASTTSNEAKINNGTNTYTGTMNDLGFSSNSLVLTVTPETGSEEKYTINVTRTKSNNANLTDLQVDGSSLDGFDGTTNGTYTLDDQDSTKASVGISYTKANEYATIVITNNGTTVSGNTVSLSEGNNKIVVAVTSQDESKTIKHTINIKKKSSTATLGGLSVSSDPQGTMEEFATGTKTYTYTYDETVGNVTINATATHNEAMVKIGSETATKGSATSNSIDPKTTSSVDIVITAEDGHSIDTYKINFTRKKSNVNTLKSLSITDKNSKEYVTDSPFNESKDTYNITVENDIDELNISAAAKSDVAVINGGTNTYSDKMSNLGFDSNTLTLTIKPEDGTNKTITINVTRKKSNNANLTDLRVDGTTVNGFNKEDDSTPFDIGSVDNDVTTLDITYDKENSESTVVIDGNTLSVGDNTILVKVTSQDKSNSREYKIKVRRKSTDTGLSNIEVISDPTGELTGPDSNDVYTYKYDRSVTSVVINATANSGKPVLNTGTHNIVDGDVSLTVTSENGETRNYTVKFEQKLENNSSLSNLEVSKDGTAYDFDNDKTFSPTETSYSLTVDPDVDKVSIAATLAGSYAKKITINGEETLNPTGKISKEVSLNPGSNNIAIVVVAENDTDTTYNITITRTINSNASLTDLQVDGKTVKDFSPSTTLYNLEAVAYAKDSINIEYTASAGANVTGDTGIKNLKPGDNTFEINVTSQDGKNNAKYTIKIRRKLNNAKITDLESSSGTKLTKSDSSEFKYKLEIPFGTNTVSLTPTFAEGATLKSPASLNNIDVTSINEIRFVVQAEDTDTAYNNEYIVELNKLKSTKLSGLSVDKGTLDPTFNKDTKNYTVNVDSSVDKINVTATKEDSTASVSGDGEHNLVFGENTITVTVTATDTEATTYTIKVTRSKSNDTSLKSLTIDGNTIDGFTSTKDNYEISLPYGTTSFELDAEPTNSNASIPDSELGTKKLSGNTGTFTFTVTAQDNTTKTYTIKVTVAGNDDTSIDSLTVLGKTPTWNAAQNRYELTVDGETLKITPDDVTATFTNGASITNKDPEMTLSQGANTYKFTVTAEDETTTNEYSVVITREKSTVNTLNSLTSDVGKITPTFKPEETAYKLTLPEGATEFTISAEATSKNPATSISGTGKYTLPVTDNLISIPVTAEDGSVKTYEITVEVSKSTIDKITSSSHTIDDNYVLTVRPELSFDDAFKGQFDNEPSELVLYLSDGKTKFTNSDNEYIGTGMILKLERDGNVLDEKTIVILGDTNGDGRIRTSDGVFIVSHVLGRDLLTGPYLLAADTNPDGLIRTSDGVFIVSHVLGRSNLYESR